MREVERIVLGRGSVTGLVNLRGMGPLKVVLRIGRPTLVIRILLGSNWDWI
jgi:hypothetical protein